MAAWLPILKAALPYVGNIVAAALPVFTRRQDASAELVSRQIAELQEAVTGNAEAVKVLAAQVEKTLTALAAGESELAQRLRQELSQELKQDLSQQLSQQISPQLASLNAALDRCENTANLAQAQASRLDGVAAALQQRSASFEQDRGASRHRELVIAAIALFALLLAVIALVR